MVSASGQNLTKEVLDSLKHACWMQEFACPFWKGRGCQVVVVDSDWSHSPSSNTSFIYVGKKEVTDIVAESPQRRRDIYYIQDDTTWKDTVIFHLRSDNWWLPPDPEVLPIVGQRLLYTIRHPSAPLKYPVKWMLWVASKPRSMFSVSRNWCWFSSPPFDYRAYFQPETHRWILRSWEEDKELWKATHPSQARFWN